MRNLLLATIVCSLAVTARAQSRPDAGAPTDAAPTAPLAPEPEPPTQPEPTPSAPSPTPSAPAPPPTTAAPAPPPTTAAPAPPQKRAPSKPRCQAENAYYSCERAYGIFHNTRLVVGALTGDVPVTTMDPTGAMSTSIESKTMASLAFEGGFLGIPSSFGPNFHGFEVSTGVRASKFDFWLSFGTAFTVLNLGHGGPGTLRLGGGFGAGFNLAHGYGYLRGRGALVIVPEKVDVEFSYQWIPTPASTTNYEERNTRISAWYRLDRKKRRAIEIYVEKLSRVDANPMVQKDREIEGGVGGGVGFSFL